jgi:hypothetical protein
MRQGLYRLGNGDNPSMFRVSEYPHGAGKESSLTLQDLKAQVFATLGKPGEFKPPPKAPEVPVEKKTEAPTPPQVPPPLINPAASLRAAPAASETSERWIGGVVICLILALVAGVIIWKRKAHAPG